MQAPRHTAVDTVREAAQQASGANRVTVRTARTMQGVRLRADAAEGAAAGSIDDLIRRFSPEFIVFPEATGHSRRPSSQGPEDYHPRAVEAYLEHARPYVASPRGWLSFVYVITIVMVVAFIGASWLMRLVGAPISEWNLRVVLLLVGALVVVALLLVAAAPRTISELRDRIARGEASDRLGIRQAWFEPPLDSWWANRAWRAYARRVVASGRYPRTLYARAVESGAELYLQYWQFYVFNDWYNKHEADWEVVVVRLAPNGDDWAAVGAAYSSHSGGHWRPTDEITWRDATHPVVYVAQGSHAQYFESKPGAYRASLTKSIGTLEVQLARRDWTEVLAGEPDPGSIAETYRIALMPSLEDASAWTPEQMREWWWLRYRGLWGGTGAITGPHDQGRKWAEPASWIDADVDRDSAAWATLRLEGDPHVVR
jgi:hypothetical protein